MKRPRIKTFERVRSTNPVTNIFDHRTGTVREKTTTSKLFANHLNCGVNITPCRTSF